MQNDIQREIINVEDTGLKLYKAYNSQFEECKTIAVFYYISYSLMSLGQGLLLNLFHKIQYIIFHLI
jgi:hypothetical protein